MNTTQFTPSIHHCTSWICQMDDNVMHLVKIHDSIEWNTETDGSRYKTTRHLETDGWNRIMWYLETGNCQFDRRVVVMERLCCLMWSHVAWCADES